MSETSHKSAAEAKTQLTELLAGFKTAMLASTDPATGVLHARPMQVLRVEPAGTLWFATYVNSAKVSECAAQPSPVLCTLQSASSWVSLTGRADVERDRALCVALWKESELRPWFPDGPHDANYALMRFTPAVGEFWDQSGVGRQLALLLEEGRAFFTRTKAEPQKVGTHEKVTVNAPLNSNPIA